MCVVGWAKASSSLKLLQSKIELLLFFYYLSSSTTNFTLSSEFCVLEIIFLFY